MPVAVDSAPVQPCYYRKAFTGMAITHWFGMPNAREYPQTHGHPTVCMWYMGCSIRPGRGKKEWMEKQVISWALYANIYRVVLNKHPWAGGIHGP